jgi:hypothetical protein
MTAPWKTASSNVGPTTRRDRRCVFAACVFRTGNTPARPLLRRRESRNFSLPQDLAWNRSGNNSHTSKLLRPRNPVPLGGLTRVHSHPERYPHTCGGWCLSKRSSGEVRANRNSRDISRPIGRSRAVSLSSRSAKRESGVFNPDKEGLACHSRHQLQVARREKLPPRVHGATLPFSVFNDRSHFDFAKMER